MEYRTMRPSDCAAVATIEATVADGWSESAVSGALSAPSARCFVAVENGEVAAFAAFTLVCDTANLDAVSTAPAQRRHGAARGLLRHALAVLQQAGATEITLEVRAQNAPARALYKSLGFVQNGLRRCFYTKPSDDALLLVLQLPAAPLSQLSCAP